MFQGFRDFLTRGNVVDLAVGFVMGIAFAAVVTQFTESFIGPLIQLVTGGEGATGVWTVRGVAFDWSSFVNAAIAFLITAAVVYYLVVVPMNRWARRGGDAPASDEVRLLTEIRDRLPAAPDPGRQPR